MCPLPPTCRSHSSPPPFSQQCWLVWMIERTQLTSSPWKPCPALPGSLRRFTRDTYDLYILINIALRIRPCFEKVNNYSCVGAVCTLCRKEVLVSHDQYRNSGHNSSLEDTILRIEPSFCGMLKIVRKLIPPVFSQMMC